MRNSIPLLVDALVLPTSLSHFSEGDGGNELDLAKCENCTTSALALQALSNIDGRYLSDHWDPQDPKLRSKLAVLHDVDTSQVFLVRGGMGGIRYAFEILTVPGTRVGLLKPDFPFWWDAKRARTDIVSCAAVEYPFYHSTDEIARFVLDERLGFLIMSNPNAATGTKKSAEELDALFKAASPDVYFAIDEADATETDSAACLTKKYGNVLFIRSFSKFYGLSGLRIGYIVVPPALAKHFQRYIDFLEVTSLGMIAASAVLDDVEFQRRTQERVRESLETIESACRGTRYKIIPGSSCFACYLWADADQEDPYIALKRVGVKLAKSSIFGLTRGGRINLSDPTLIRRSVKVIRQTL